MKQTVPKVTTTKRIPKGRRNQVRCSYISSKTIISLKKPYIEQITMKPSQHIPREKSLGIKLGRNSLTDLTRYGNCSVQLPPRGEYPKVEETKIVVHNILSQTIIGPKRPYKDQVSMKPPQHTSREKSFGMKLGRNSFTGSTLYVNHGAKLLLRGEYRKVEENKIVVHDNSSKMVIRPKRDVFSRQLSDADRVKITKSLRGVKVEVAHRGNMCRKHRISGLATQATREPTFPVDEIKEL